MGDYPQLFSARTHARVMALRLLYQSEMTGRTIADLLGDDACTFSNEYEDLCRQPIGSTGLSHDCAEFPSCEYRTFFSQYGGDIDTYSLKIAYGVVSKWS